ncbi:hypothetical protein BIZ37_05800 [Photobacterium sp. BZF1]|nr:hypothetical protein [Photobacterium sp. BZF1]
MNKKWFAIFLLALFVSQPIYAHDKHHKKEHCQFDKETGMFHCKKEDG